MKDIVISSQKIEKLVKKELKSRYGKVPTKIHNKVLKGVNNILKDYVNDIVDEIPSHVEGIVQSSFSLEEVFPNEGGK